MKRFYFGLLLLLGIASAAVADEGMWTFDNFPNAAVKQNTASTSTTPGSIACAAHRARLSGCTGSFVSPTACADQSSLRRELPRAELRAASDLRRDGLHRRSARRRARVPDADRRRARVGIEDITAKVNAATAGLRDANGERSAQADARAASNAKPASQAKGNNRSSANRDAVPGRPVLALQVQALRRRAPRVRARSRHRGVRRRPRQLPVPALVPRLHAAARLRERQAGATPSTCDRLRTARAPASRCSSPATPARTDRLLTVAAAQVPARPRLPPWLAALLRAARPLHPVRQDGRRAASASWRTRCSASRTRIKVRAASTRCSTTADGARRRRRKPSCAARRAIQARAEIGDPWEDIEKAQARIEQHLHLPYLYLEAARASTAGLFATRARWCAARPSAPSRTASAARVPDGVCRARAAARRARADLSRARAADASFSLERMREWLGPDHPWCASCWRKESPDELAARARDGTKLADPAVRKAAVERRRRAIAASTDPMIVLARASTPTRARCARRTRTKSKRRVAARSREDRARASRARHERLSRRDVHAAAELRQRAGLDRERQAGRAVHAAVARLFERATGKPPFRLPRAGSMREGQARLERRRSTS